MNASATDTSPFNDGAISQALNALSQLASGYSRSVLQTQAEVLNRNIHDLEEQIAALAEPNLTSDKVAWARAIDLSAAKIVPGFSTVDASSYFLQAQASLLKGYLVLVEQNLKVTGNPEATTQSRKAKRKVPVA